MNVSEQQLIDLYENAPCGFHALNAEGLFVHINRTELEWLGYSYDQVVGRMHLTDLLTLEGRHTFERNFKQFKSTGMVRDVEFDFVRRDGTLLPVLVSATAVYDAEGKYLMSRSVVYDLAERLHSHVWFRAILDAAPDAMLITSRSGDILMANAQAEKLFGYRADEMYGRSVEILVPADVRDGHLEHRAGFFAENKARPMGSGYEIRGIRKDGSEIPVEVSLSPLEFDRIVVAVAAIRDLTRRRNAEEKIRRSQEQYRLLFENSLDGILLTSPEGRIIEANPSACRILGRSREELLKIGREGVLDTADPAFARFVAERTATGKATGELRGKLPGGKHFSQEVSSVVFEDAEGQKCSCVIFRDITARKESQTKGN